MYVTLFVLYTVSFSALKKIQARRQALVLGRNWQNAAKPTGDWRCGGNRSIFQFVSMHSFDLDTIPVTQGTMRGLAMQYTVNVAFTPQEGMHPLHNEIPCIAAFVMDGLPHDHVTVVATQAWNAAVKIYSMDIQQADMNSLWAIAAGGTCLPVGVL